MTRHDSPDVGRGDSAVPIPAELSEQPTQTLQGRDFLHAELAVAVELPEGLGESAAGGRMR